MAYFLTFLAGAIVGGWFVKWALGLGLEKALRDGEMFAKIKGRWYPYDPKV